jgi:hypothetical protein
MDKIQMKNRLVEIRKELVNLKAVLSQVQPDTQFTQSDLLLPEIANQLCGNGLCFARR